MTTDIDIDFVRSRFPGLQADWAFFDNAGGTQILSGAVERMNDFLFNMNVQIGGSYEVSLKAAAAMRAGREAMLNFGPLGAPLPFWSSAARQGKRPSAVSLSTTASPSS